MSKKLICILIAVLLLSAGCTAKPQTAQTTETAQLSGDDTQPPQTELPTQPQQFSDDPAIAAVWVSGGETPDGQDYVETMSLLSDGAAFITIEYQGSFQTLTGTYKALNSVLTVEIDDDPPYQKIYQYELDANVLTLTNEEKNVTYRRSD